MKQNKRVEKMLLTQELLVKLNLVDRNHYTAGTNRKENDSEHTLSLATLCWLVYFELDSKLNLEKIIKYEIAHDIPEVYAGDVNTFSNSKQRRNKVIAEHQAVKRIKDEYAFFPDLIKHIDGYETKKDKEAIFVWTADKMQALTMGSLDEWRPYREINITYAMFCKKYEELIENSLTDLKPLFKELFEYCKATYYDRP
jgi:5'-deoxynucleotidase YfbR-like HD superfamily hydrolase